MISIWVPMISHVWWLNHHDFPVTSNIHSFPMIIPAFQTPNDSACRPKRHLNVYILYYIILLYYILLYYIILYYILLYYIILYCYIILLYYTILYCIKLYYIILHIIYKIISYNIYYTLYLYYYTHIYIYIIVYLHMFSAALIFKFPTRPFGRPNSQHLGETFCVLSTVGGDKT